jgi:hypothetical protein
MREVVLMGDEATEVIISRLIKKEHSY